MNVRLEIVDLRSLDIDDPSSWRPAAPEQVYLVFELEIGEAGVSGAHVFQLLVATPEGLNAHHRGRARAAFDAMSGRRNGLAIDAMLVLDRYRWPSLRDLLSQRVASCERATWAESLDCLRAKFFWEYEGLERR